MKTILVDAVNTFLIKDHGIFQEMYNLLEKYLNRKIIVYNKRNHTIIIYVYRLFNLK